ncbi:MAG: DUF2065 domain-containing protein [Gammaproteobacteria bacterium]|nr:DUF2065 domain-containing protein [Gammaproteobacteria bacterium]
MWQDLLGAVALILVIEGMLPFINPTAMRRALLTLARMDDHALRFAGLTSMLAGVVILYVLR